MARYVHEIMSPELFFLRPNESVENALIGIIALTVTGAPVVDEGQRPVGHISMRDLLGTDGHRVGDRMSTPAVTISQDADIRDAALTLAKTDLHRLIVVDEAGAAVGVVSSVDLLRALVDLPARHPATLPHSDAQGVSWSDPIALGSESASHAPDGPGLFMLVHDEANMAIRPLWAEASKNVRQRLKEILAAPHEQDPLLRQIVNRDRAHLRVRAAWVEDPERRARSLHEALESVASP